MNSVDHKILVIDDIKLNFKTIENFRAVVKYMDWEYFQLDTYRFK